MAKVDMREVMPQTAAFIDDLRAAFGAEMINTQIRRGMRGEPVFHAVEGGHSVGTPMPHGVRVGRDARGNSYLLDGPLPEDEKFRKPSSIRERHYLRLQMAKEKAEQAASADVCNDKGEKL